MRHIESDRKRLELEVEAKKELIERYSLQQFQTKKNEEYRALAHEIELARKAIVKLEDEQLELMEQGETAQKRVHAAQQLADDSSRSAERQVADLAVREQNLKAELERLETEREQLTGEVDPSILPCYERLRKSKGERVVVGIAHGVCGGCPMRLPAQVMITCQSSQEIPRKMRHCAGHPASSLS